MQVALIDEVVSDTPPLLRDFGYISIGDLARRLSMSVQAVGKLAKRLNLKRTLVGRRLFYSLEEIERALKAGGLQHKRKGRPPKGGAKGQGD